MIILHFNYKLKIKKNMLNVLGNAVLILPDVQPERTATGRIIIPATTKELAPEEGTAIKVGPACVQVRAGDHVLFPRKSCSIADIDGVIHYFLNEPKIKYHESI
jgi:co-chaperonin GroES (HSP10)